MGQIRKIIYSIQINKKKFCYFLKKKPCKKKYI